MKTLKTSLLLTALLALGSAAHAEVVGRVLMAAGDTSVIRDSRELRVAVGFPVQDKDTLKTGPTSNMQVRFTDESIVSLRDQSLLKIDEYKFTGKQDGLEKAFFNLLKGGFRTVTGVIGQVNKTNYGVKTATATIGIRGTHFALLHCTAGSCGAAAKDGVYGGVSGGIIAAINKTGEYQFGSGDYFYAPSQDTPVKKLIGPPEFFADQLAGRKRGGTKEPSTGTGKEQAENSGYASNPAQSYPRQSYLDPSVTSLDQPVYVVTNNRTPNTTVNGGLCALGASCPGVPPAVFGPVSAQVVSTQGAGGIAYFFTGGGGNSTGFPFSGSFTFNSIDPHEITSYSSSNASGSLGSASVSPIDSDIDPTAGNVRWGRWVGTGSIANGPSVFSCNNCNLHYAIGDIPTMPTLGAATYTSVGGTRTTNAAGMIGSVGTGLVTVNFLDRSMNTNIQFSFNGASYNMSGPTIFLANGQFATNFGGTCSGPSCGGSTSVSGAYAGSFTGANAAGIGMVYHALNSSGPNGDIVGALGFKR